jgi:hypothetical protein
LAGVWFLCLIPGEALIQLWLSQVERIYALKERKAAEAAIKAKNKTSVGTQVSPTLFRVTTIPSMSDGYLLLAGLDSFCGEII